MTEVMELGSSIELIDFKDVERDKFVVVKKIVGNLGLNWGFGHRYS